MTIEEQLARDEGFRPHAYQDSVGKLTIGIGRNLDDVGISHEEALVLLANDVKCARILLADRLPWTVTALDEARKGVLINMCFNMGIFRLLEFKQFLAALQAADYKLAAAQMLDSKWAKQVGGRAQRLAAQIETGVWQ